MKRVIELPFPRLLLGLMSMGVILVAGGFYLSWQSLDEEHVGNPLPPAHQGPLPAQSPSDFPAVTGGSPAQPAQTVQAAESSGATAEIPVSLGDSSMVKAADVTDASSGGVDAQGGVGTDPQGSDSKDGSRSNSSNTGVAESDEESSDGIALPPAIFNATRHPELTDIPPDVIEGLAREFVEKVKQGGWDNTSEAYRKNWEKAVEEVNETFKAAYGYDAYLKLTSGGTN